MTSETIRQQFFENPQLRTEWQAIIRSHVWRMATDMVRLQQTEAAAAAPLDEPDFMTARRTCHLKGALSTLRLLEMAAAPPAEIPEAPSEPWAHLGAIPPQ
jgi:hypothetical protein